MATETPNVAAPMWESAQASPWLTQNLAARIWDALASSVIVEELARNAPPGSCADGAKYIVGTGSGVWAGHNGQLAVAIGANASNGWQHADVATEGFLLHNKADGLNYRYTSGAWVAFADAVSRLQDLLDVDVGGILDGYVLTWDASNGVFYFAPPSSVKPTESFVFACSDETTALTAGTGKITWRLPYAFTVTEVFASLVTAQTSGNIFTVDVNSNGSSILGTKLTIENGETDSDTSANPPQITTANLPKRALITADIDQIGDGTAKGLKVALVGHQT